MPTQTFDEYSTLRIVLGVFYESIRLYRTCVLYWVAFLQLLIMPLAAGYLVFREATKDTVINVPKPIGESGTIPLPVKKGERVVIDMVGMGRLDMLLPCSPGSSD